METRSAKSGTGEGREEKQVVVAVIRQSALFVVVEMSCVPESGQWVSSDTVLHFSKKLAW